MNPVAGQGDVESEPRSLLRQQRSFADFREGSFFHNLDGLRAIAILLVIFHHTIDKGTAAFTLQQNGRFGVSLFFVISGFLICSLLLREADRFGTIDLKRFYMRRALRLFPLYYGVLLLYCVITFGFQQFSVENREIFSEKLLSYIFYYSNWVAVSPVGPFFFAWSLAAEEQFYLTFGQVMRWLSRHAVMIGIVGLLLLKAVLLNTGLVAIENPFVIVFLSYQEPILMGVLLAFALHTERGYVLFQRTISNRGLLIAILGLSGILSLYWLDHHHTPDTLFIYLFMAVIVGGVATRNPLPVLRNSFLCHIGKISYGIYLFHMLAIITAKRITDNLALKFVLGSAIAIVVASVSYRYFESPILALKSRFAPGKRCEPAMESSSHATSA